MTQYPDATIATFVNCPLMNRLNGDEYKGIIHVNKEKEEDCGKLIVYKPLEQGQDGELIPIADETTAIKEMSSICNNCEYRNLHDTEVGMRNVFMLKTGELARTCAVLIKNS